MEAWIFIKYNSFGQTVVSHNLILAFMLSGFLAIGI